MTTYRNHEPLAPAHLMTRRTFLRAGMAGLGLAAGATALAGCSNQHAATTGSDGLKKVTFALDWTPNTNHTGVYVAKERGYYKDAGLSVKIVQAPENGADPLVASGKAQFGVSFQDTMATYVAGDEKLPVTAIAAIIQHNTSGIISLKDKGITSPAKMVDHTYATWELPIEQGIIKRCVEADGGDYSKVKLVPSTVTDEVSALKTDQVDSIWIYYAWAGIKCKPQGSTPTTLPSRTSTAPLTTTRRSSSPATTDRERCQDGPGVCGCHAPRL